MAVDDFCQFICPFSVVIREQLVEFLALHLRRFEFFHFARPLCDPLTGLQSCVKNMYNVHISIRMLTVSPSTSLDAATTGTHKTSNPVGAGPTSGTSCRRPGSARRWSGAGRSGGWRRGARRFFGGSPGRRRWDPEGPDPLY